MTPDQLLAILTDNISFQLRHANYDRTIEVKKTAKMISAAIGWEDEVTRYRRFEKDDLKEQRIRLHNPPSKAALAAPRRYFKRMPRVEGIRRTFTVDKGNEKALTELQNDFYNFMPGESLEQWQNRTLEYLGVNDPNAWIVAERKDARNIEGTIIKTTVYPVVYGSEDVLNVKRTFGVLDWIIFRTTEMQNIGTKSGRIDQIIENYYLYAPGYIAQAREVGEKTVLEKGDVEMNIPVYPASDGKQSSNPAIRAIEYTGQPKDRKFYVRVKTNGTTEVPADCAGVYYDETREKLDSFVTWFDPALSDFLDLMRYKTAEETAIATHAYPHTWEFAPKCHDRHVDLGECDYGYYNGIRDSEHKCVNCNGTGIPANFTTDQAKVMLILPEEGQKELLRLAELSYTQDIKIDFMAWLSEKVTATTAKIMNTLFGSGLFQRPTNSATKTATEVNALTDGISDVLAPFGAVDSRHFEMFYRVGAQYRGFTLDVDKSYPDYLGIETLGDLVAGYSDIKTAGVGYEAIVAQRNRIFQKQFEGNPQVQKQIAARYKFKPFDDKTETQEAMIIAGLSPTDDTRILWAYWLQIFQEIENKYPKFYEMTYDLQKEKVADEVAIIKATIMEPQIDNIKPPDFNPGNPAPDTGRIPANAP
jgi:hypothetical protein